MYSYNKQQDMESPWPETGVGEGSLDNRTSLRGSYESDNNE
jgi:hypothetical protein